MYIYYLILAAVFFAGFAMCIDKGIWSNTLMLINIVISGLVAFGNWDVAASLIADNGAKSYVLLLPFLMIWTIYVIVFILLHRVGSQLLSRTKMRFKHPIDSIGGPITAVLVGYISMCLVAASLHAAPLGLETMGGALVYDEDRSSNVITNPDMTWLWIAQNALNEDNMGKNGGFDATEYVGVMMGIRMVVDASETLRVRVDEDE